MRSLSAKNRIRTLLTSNQATAVGNRPVPKILELLRAHKAKEGDRAKKLLQFLNLIGARSLARHLGRVLEMAESSVDKTEYETKVARRFGLEQQLELPVLMPTPPEMKEAAH